MIIFLQTAVATAPPLTNVRLELKNGPKIVKDSSSTALERQPNGNCRSNN